MTGRRWRKTNCTIRRIRLSVSCRIRKRRCRCSRRIQRATRSTGSRQSGRDRSHRAPALYGETQGRQHDTDIVMKNTLDQPYVLFPTRRTTSGCPAKCVMRRCFDRCWTVTQSAWQRILDGEICGVCHGAVSFPLTECNRCHSVSRDDRSRSSSGAVVPKQ